MAPLPGVCWIGCSRKGSGSHAICGVSSGAFIGGMLAQGLVRDRRAGACVAMRALLQRFAWAYAMSLLQNAPLGRCLNGEEEFLALLFNAGRAAAAMQGLPEGVPGFAAGRSRAPATSAIIRIATP
jgi:hypothetical protein